MPCSSGSLSLQAAPAIHKAHAITRPNAAARQLGTQPAAVQQRLMTSWQTHARQQQHLGLQHSREVRTASMGRRALLGSLAPCCCSCSSCGRRIGWYDKYFAFNMAHGMEEYEAAIAPLKQAMFKQLLTPLVANTSTAADLFNILEVGLGTGPNLPFYTQILQDSGTSGSTTSPDVQRRPPSYVITGVEPNLAMWEYAQAAAQQAGLKQQQLQLVAADVQSMPFEESMFDAAVVTLVLCSLPNPKAALSEVLRVLKPGGQVLLIEHVIDPQLSWRQVQQRLLNPLQMLLADNCHLTRDTAAAVQSSGLEAYPLQLPAVLNGLQGLQLVAEAGVEVGSYGTGMSGGLWRLRSRVWG